MIFLRVSIITHKVNAGFGFFVYLTYLQEYFKPVAHRPAKHFQISRVDLDFFSLSPQLVGRRSHLAILHPRFLPPTGKILEDSHSNK